MFLDSTIKASAAQKCTPNSFQLFEFFAIGGILRTLLNLPGLNRFVKGFDWMINAMWSPLEQYTVTLDAAVQLTQIKCARRIQSAVNILRMQRTPGHPLTFEVTVKKQEA